ncbi:hypothetical protein EON65_11685 [archaeon]|nr:MAG: hypothetical protein EON65_11685 [archaeon]
MTKAKAITPAKPQKSLFSFFQKSDKTDSLPGTAEKEEKPDKEDKDKAFATVTPSPAAVSKSAVLSQDVRVYDLSLSLSFFVFTLSYFLRNIVDNCQCGVEGIPYQGGQDPCRTEK